MTSTLCAGGRVVCSGTSRRRWHDEPPLAEHFGNSSCLSTCGLRCAIHTEDDDMQRFLRCGPQLDSERPPDSEFVRGHARKAITGIPSGQFFEVLRGHIHDERHRWAGAAQPLRFLVPVELHSLPSDARATFAVKFIPVAKPRVDPTNQMRPRWDALNVVRVWTRTFGHVGKSADMPETRPLKSCSFGRFA